MLLSGGDSRHTWGQSAHVSPSQLLHLASPQTRQSRLHHASSAADRRGRGHAGECLALLRNVRMGSDLLHQSPSLEAAKKQRKKSKEPCTRRGVMQNVHVDAGCTTHEGYFPTQPSLRLNIPIPAKTQAPGTACHNKPPCCAPHSLLVHAPSPHQPGQSASHEAGLSPLR